MSRRGIKYLISVSVLVISVPILAQTTTTVYGAEIFKASLKGVESSRTFQAKSNVDAILILQNGDGRDLSPEKCTGTIVQKLVCAISNVAKAIEVALVRPTSVDVMVNSKKLVSGSSYQPELGKIQVSFKTLTGTPVAAVVNQLKITVKGLPLAQVKLEIKAQSAAVNQSPIAQFSFNPNNSLAPALVSFSGLQSNDPDGQIASYSWNFGDGGTATGSMVTHSFATAGLYNVRLTVTDNQGATGTVVQVVTVISDSTAPSLASINQRFVIKSLPGSLSISLTASETLASASVGGQALVVSGSQASGSISVTQAGSLNLQVQLRDLAGNVSTQSRIFNVILDQNIPVIVAGIADVVTTNQNRISIPITVTDESEVMTTLTLNGVQVLSSQSKQFTYDLSLPSDGEYRLVISGFDEAERVAQVREVVVRRDTVAPVLSNIQPTDALPMNSRLIVVTGSVSENANITINGVVASVSMGSFSATVRATRDGTFPIVIQATDAANNQSTASFNVLVDTGSDRLWTYEECPIEGSL